MLHYLHQLFQALDFTSMWDAVLRVAAVFLCLTIHETCHGLAALVLGDPTARAMHRLSLNPLRHIDWIGLLLMFAAGFGWAKPVPVDPRYFKNPKLAPLSIGLGVFNLIPIPPLDGSKVLGALLPDRLYAVQLRYERYGFAVLLVLSFLGIGGGVISRGIITVYNAFVALIFV